MGEYEKDWQATQTEVQNRSVQMGETLKQQDYQNKLAELTALREGASIEEAEGIRQQGLAQQASSAAAAIQNAKWQEMMQGTCNNGQSPSDISQDEWRKPGPGGMGGFGRNHQNQAALRGGTLEPLRRPSHFPMVTTQWSR
jgi:hypothetical protein